MKVISSIRKICKYCKIIRRNKNNYVICKVLKHKQKQK